MFKVVTCVHACVRLICSVCNECVLRLRSPSSLDAYVFGHLAPLLKIKLPNAKLQQHLTSLENLQQFCTNILLLYFPSDSRGSRFLLLCVTPQRCPILHSDWSEGGHEVSITACLKIVLVLRQIAGLYQIVDILFYNF